MSQSQPSDRPPRRDGACRSGSGAGRGGSAARRRLRRRRDGRRHRRSAALTRAPRLRSPPKPVSGSRARSQTPPALRLHERQPPAVVDAADDRRGDPRAANASTDARLLRRARQQKAEARERQQPRRPGHARRPRDAVQRQRPAHARGLEQHERGAHDAAHADVLAGAHSPPRPPTAARHSRREAAPGRVGAGVPERMAPVHLPTQVDGGDQIVARSGVEAREQAAGAPSTAAASAGKGCAGSCGRRRSEPRAAPPHRPCRARGGPPPRRWWRTGHRRSPAVGRPSRTRR